VNTDGTIDLTVSPEVSALDYTNAVSISGYTIPALSTRRVNTRVVLRSGQSFAVSGLLDKRTTDQLSHTPGIASIPILGALFRSKGVNHSNSELIVIVTPTIVDPLTDFDSPVEPKPIVPPMNSKAFDDALPAKTKKQD
jgi:pilus assembly protein CpaC